MEETRSLRRGERKAAVSKEQLRKMLNLSDRKFQWAEGQLEEKKEAGKDQRAY